MTFKKINFDNDDTDEQPDTEETTDESQEPESIVYIQEPPHKSGIIRIDEPKRRGRRKADIQPEVKPKKEIIIPKIKVDDLSCPERVNPKHYRIAMGGYKRPFKRG